jgi:predicted component of type VI protein secretion system
MSAHQLSHRLLSHVDRLVLLSRKGHLIYHGSPAQVDHYFSALGYQRADDVTISEFLLELACHSHDGVLTDLKQAFRSLPSVDQRISLISHLSPATHLAIPLKGAEQRASVLERRESLPAAGDVVYSSTPSSGPPVPLLASEITSELDASDQLLPHSESAPSSTPTTTQSLSPSSSAPQPRPPPSSSPLSFTMIGPKPTPHLLHLHT